jgi:hypothetical protein
MPARLVLLPDRADVPPIGLGRVAIAGCFT